MRYRFGACRLDTDAGEIRLAGQSVAVQPQVFRLLQVLLESGGNILSKDDLIDRVWDGRIVSDAAIASRIKSARQAIGDDGQQQAMIVTLPKRGYRFVVPVNVEEGVAEVAPAPPFAPLESTRPAIAVLPFEMVGGASGKDWLAEALADEVIVELSRLRWLFVIARGSSFRFRGPVADASAIGARLNVGYCVTGRIAPGAGRISVTVELSDTRSGGIVWSERYERDRRDLQVLHGEIAQAIAAALDLHIPVHEALRSESLAVEALDAWGLYHLGLRSLYRFDRQANEHAAGCFERALALSPRFARAHAGLSFCRFEDSFLGFTTDKPAASLAARRAAEAALDCDPLDPFCNMVMGRALWLQGDPEASQPWLQRAIGLSPNYAQARYVRGLTSALLGDAEEAAREAQAALRLSPFDPMAYGMVGVRALAALADGDAAAAVEWSERAARTPGAHALIELMAAISCELDGQAERARDWASSAAARHPTLTASQFLQAFPFRTAGLAQAMAASLGRLGF